MKMLSILFVTALALSTTAKASYLESCEFEVKVQSMDKLAVVDNVSHQGMGSIITIVEVIDAKNAGSHLAGACERYKHQVKVLQLSPEISTTIQTGTILTLSYFFVSGRNAQGGISSSSRWTLIQ